MQPHSLAYNLSVIHSQTITLQICEFISLKLITIIDFSQFLRTMKPVIMVPDNSKKVCGNNNSVYGV
jgi:hypothetical protein